MVSSHPTDRLAVTEPLVAALAAVACSLVVSPAMRTGRTHADRPTDRVHDLVRWSRARILTHRSVAQRREAVREAVAAMAAELAAGHSASRALERAFAPSDIAPTSRAAVAWGGDVTAALHADARQPGCALLAHVSACWSVAHGTGAGLAESLRRAVEADRSDDEVRSQLTAHLAAPRATSRMLAGLPALGLLLGIAMGGDPLAWLFGTPFGIACLAGGAALTVMGLLWTSRIAARVEALL